MKKRSFYSDQLWLCSPLHLALHFLTTRRQQNRTGQLHVIAHKSLPLLGERLILDYVHVGFSFKIVQCNNCVPSYHFLCFLFLFFQLVPSLYQNTFRIESKRTILTLSICYRVYIVLTLKPDWLLFNILLSNIKILSFFLKDGIQ